MPIPIPGAIAEQLRRSTVRVIAGAYSEGSGSGAVLLGSQVITNAHVTGGENEVVVESWEGRNTRATVLKRDTRRDLALLSVPGLNAPSLILADSDRARAGMPVLAIGNPLGFVGAASSGVIHAVTPRWIEADLRLAPGNSGGPLANLQGEVIGLNTMVMVSRTMGAITQGIAMAIPSRAVQAFLARRGEPRSLGITIRPVDLRNGTPALLILEVAPGGPAEQASLLAGDLLVGVNGHNIREPEDLAAAIDAASETLHLQFYRGWRHQGEAPRREVAVRLQPEPARYAA